jgi:LacI family transcriptional regulator
MPTIRDVAKKAGVGVATVSRHIAGKGFVADKTAKKIRKAIEALQYRPSHLARSLPSGKTQTIGIYMPVIFGAFYAPMLHTICATLRKAGVRMMVAIGSDTCQERDQTLQGLQFLAEHGCDGLIAIGSTLKTSDVAALIGLRKHIAVLNRSLQGLRTKCFAPDHIAAGRLAAATLWDAGHRRIAAIEGNKQSVDNIARMRGFMDELAKRGADVDAIPVVCGHFSPEGGRDAAQTLLEQHGGFTALFCASDESAFGALSHLHEAGVSVPRDVSVLGYDGLQLTLCTAPPLTTIRIPWDEICVSGTHYVLNECYGSKLPVQRAFAAEVLWRESLNVIGHAASQVHAGEIA